MKERNKNRPGYKKTKGEWIPEEWEEYSLNEACFRSRIGADGSDPPLRSLGAMTSCDREL